MFPTYKNSQIWVKNNRKSTEKHSSFDGLIQEDIDLSDIYLAVWILFRKMFSEKRKKKTNFPDKKCVNEKRKCVNQSRFKKIAWI